MNASKETAVRAQETLDQIEDHLRDRGNFAEEIKSDIEVIREFLLAAQRKLPTESSYEREKLRKRAYRRKDREHAEDGVHEVIQQPGKRMKSQIVADDFRGMES